MKDLLYPLLPLAGWLAVWLLTWLASFAENMLGSPEPRGPSKRRIGPIHRHAKMKLLAHFLIFRSKIDAWMARRVRD